MKNLTRYFGLTLLISLLSYNNANAESVNVEIRAEGVGVFSPDTINGHQAMIASGFPVTFTVSAELDFGLDAATLTFILYSPDMSVTGATHIGVDTTQAWIDAFAGGFAETYFAFDSWDGIFPDTLFTAGVQGVNEPQFGPAPLTDLFSFTVLFPQSTDGVVCVDSAFKPPAGDWLFVGPDINEVSPTWGANSGGYPDGGYCVTLSSELSCCSIPGDADHGGSSNIGDATYIGKYIFMFGPAPPCLEEADADGSGDVNVGDVTHLIKHVFQHGYPPVCGQL